MKTPKTVNAIALPSKTVLDAIAWAKAESGLDADVIDILGPCRKKHLVILRRLAQWRLRTEYYWSFPRIGQAFNGRDHSSVMHLVQLENIKRGYPQYHPVHSTWGHISQARHEAHLMRMRIKYAGGASYA
jgi:hypothetical protein